MTMFISYICSNLHVLFSNLDVVNKPLITSPFCLITCVFCGPTSGSFNSFNLCTPRLFSFFFTREIPISPCQGGVRTIQRGERTKVFSHSIQLPNVRPPRRGKILNTFMDSRILRMFFMNDFILFVPFFFFNPLSKITFKMGIARYFIFCVRFLQ